MFKKPAMIKCHLQRKASFWLSLGWHLFTGLTVCDTTGCFQKERIYFKGRHVLPKIKDTDFKVLVKMICARGILLDKNRKKK